MTEGQDRATTRVAAIVKAMCDEMLANGETGEVVIKVTVMGLEPEKHVVTKGKTVRVRDGYGTLETVS